MIFEKAKYISIMQNNCCHMLSKPITILSRAANVVWIDSMSIIHSCISGRARSLVHSYADDKVAERVGNAAGAHWGPMRKSAQKKQTAHQAGSAGPALGPTGGPGVTFQDGCA